LNNKNINNYSISPANNKNIINKESKLKRKTVSYIDIKSESDTES